MMALAELPAEDSRIVKVPGTALTALTLFLVAGFIHGWLGLGCHLVNEHRRLVWHEIVLIWTGDVVAVFWYVQYCARWIVDGPDTATPLLPQSTLPRTVWLMLGSLILSIAIE